MVSSELSGCILVPRWAAVIYFYQFKIALIAFALQQSHCHFHNCGFISLFSIPDFPKSLTSHQSVYAAVDTGPWKALYVALMNDRKSTLNLNIMYIIHTFFTEQRSIYFLTCHDCHSVVREQVWLREIWLSFGLLT